MKDLIVSAKNGDHEAFGSLYESCRKQGISIARQYVKNDTDAEDMYQDAFLKAMENIDRFDENREFGPWLNTIIANTCKDFLGKKRPMNFTDMSDEENEFVDTIASSDESSLPESVYVRKEMLKIVDGIVEMLPNEQKEATLLFYFKDFSVKQVAEYQHVSEDTVKSRLNYSRKKVEQATKDYEKKNGVKIFTASIVPAILVLYFKNSVYASQMEASLSALSASNALSTAGAGAVKAGAAAGKVAAGKIAAIAGAGIIAVSGAGLAIHHFATSGDRDETVAEYSENTSEESEDLTVADIQEEPAEEELSPLMETVKNAQVGDIIEYGTFEQDGDTSNGEEPIEWMVLAEEDGKKLLLSRYILISVGDMMVFPGEGVNYTWAECGIRTYLNGDFFESAFNEEERELIAETELRTTWSDPCSLGADLVDVETISHESFGTVWTEDVGKIVTTDRIFIPDFDEDFVRYMKIYKEGNYGYGTDILARATPASGLESYPYTQDTYDWEKEAYSEDANFDESLVGQEFGNYIMRNGGSSSCPILSEDSNLQEDDYEILGYADSTSFYVVSGSGAAVWSPYSLTELPLHNYDVGIRPMMWVEAE